MNDTSTIKNVPTRTRNIHKHYRMIAEVGSGTYGRVYKAECLRTKEFVALKKFESKDDKVKEDGFPITAVREIRLLKQLDHENVIKLREIIVSKPQEHNDFRGSTFLVFDYMDHDFAGLHRIKHEFSLPELKCVMLQILKGVQYLHEKRVIHRDLKIANILYNNDGLVKIADFGLARMLIKQNNPKYTNKVVTLWYRAPEILLGAKEYNQQVDMWSVGCIFIELAVKENLLRGENETRQLEKIYDLCGGITSTSWPEAEHLQHWKDMKPKRQFERKLRDMLIERKKNIDEKLIDLLEKLMVLNPKKRFNVQDCINHAFFHSDPLPLEPHEMSKINDECHEALIKNVQNRNQVIASQKSNFQPRGHQSPLRVHPMDRMKAQQQQHMPHMQQSQMSKSSTSHSSQQSHQSQQQQQQQQQYIGGGHFENRHRSNNSGYNNQYGHNNSSSSSSYISGGLQSRNHSMNSQQQMNQSRSRYNNYPQSSLNSSNSGVRDNNSSSANNYSKRNNQSDNNNNNSSTAASNDFDQYSHLDPKSGGMGSLSGLMSLISSKDQQSQKETGGDQNNNLTLMSSVILPQVSSQQDTNQTSGILGLRNASKISSDSAGNKDAAAAGNSEKGNAEDEQILGIASSLLKRGSNAYAMLAANQAVNSFSYGQIASSDQQQPQKMNTKRLSSPSQESSPVLKKKIKDD